MKKISKEKYNLPENVIINDVNVKKDHKGNIVWQKDSNGRKHSYRYEYNEKGDIIREELIGKYIKCRDYKYHKDGNKAYLKVATLYIADNLKLTEEYEWDCHNNLIYEKNFDGRERIYKYDKDYNLICYEKKGG